MKKKGSKNTGYPDYYVGFYGKLNEEPIFNSCFVETWDRNDAYSLMVNYRFHGYTEDEKMNIKQLGSILENIDKIENFGKEFKKNTGGGEMNGNKEIEGKTTVVTEARVLEQLEVLTDVFYMELNYWKERKF